MTWTLVTSGWFNTRNLLQGSISQGSLFLCKCVCAGSRNIFAKFDPTLACFRENDQTWTRFRCSPSTTSILRGKIKRQIALQILCSQADPLAFWCKHFHTFRGNTGRHFVRPFSKTHTHELNWHWRFRSRQNLSDLDLSSLSVSKSRSWAHHTRLQIYISGSGRWSDAKELDTTTTVSFRVVSSFSTEQANHEAHD